MAKTKAKAPSASFTTSFRNGVKYVDRLFANWGKTFSWTYDNFIGIKNRIYSRTNSGSDGHRALRIFGMFCNVILNLFILGIKLLWDFLRSV